MAIITLTSDLGSGSHYPAVLKGIIFSSYPAATIVDISHEVSSFDIMEAAYLVKNTYKAYPEGSVHLIGVDPLVHSDCESIALLHEGQFFVGPNNGVMALICEAAPEAVEITNNDIFRTQFPISFRAARCFAPASAFLASGGPLKELGPHCELKALHWGEPSYSENCLRGKIIHIDKFGNAITNIRRENFLSLKNGRRFEIFIRNVRLKRIVNTYSDVNKADALAIFGESASLEIAMREASAAELLGLKVHDMITIEFSK